MEYSSLLYIYGFLPISLAVYYLIPKKHSEKALLGLSMLFCGFTSLYFLIFMAVYILLNYTMCRLTEYIKQKGSIAEIPLASMVILDITAIFAFRAPYMEWFRNTVHAPEIFYPLGISFFTLSAVGMLTDIYKGRQKAEKNLIRYALYIVFFPRLYMGPCMQYSEFSKILDRQKRGFAQTGTGLCIFVKGLVKKVIIADSLYLLYSAVNKIGHENLTALTTLLGMTAYILCLYFTMSGIADMGRGTAECFGYRFPDSFPYPLFRYRVRLFASRWLTGVTGWFRTYIRKPLTSSSRNPYIRLVFFVLAWGMLGFWFKFSITGFVAGMIIGLVISAEGYILKKGTLKITGVFCTLVATLLWGVFLSEDSISDALSMISALFGRYGFADSLTFYFIRAYILLLAIAVFFATPAAKKLIRKAERQKTGIVISFIKPVLALAFLIICTAYISANQNADTVLFRL